MVRPAWAGAGFKAAAAAFQLGRVAGAAVGIFAVACTAAGVAISALLLPVRTGPLAVGRVVEVPSGATAREVGALLQERGLVRSGLAFAVLARAWGLDRQLQAGFYRVRPDLSLAEILRLLTSGSVVVEEVTIPEGYTIRSIASLLERRGLADAERFVALASDDRWLFGAHRPFEKPPGSLEGYLFPDTYRFVRGQSEQSIIRRMVARFAERMLPLYRELGGASGLSLHQAVILASIVEKEAVVDWERPLIASVFHNRLRRGRPLQADPTLQYVLDPPPRKLLRTHLSIDSPYNTYRYRGLPPTPIASPGEASFRAVLQPARTPYLYFVARGDGTHIFSRTFAEHVQARRSVAF